MFLIIVELHDGGIGKTAEKIAAGNRIPGQPPVPQTVLHENAVSFQKWHFCEKQTTQEHIRDHAFPSANLVKVEEKGQRDEEKRPRVDIMN